MKKKLTTVLFALAGFLFASNAIAQNTEPDKSKTSEKKLEHSDDLSEFCQPDWSGYDEVSPDISTRPLLYPNGKPDVKSKKVNCPKSQCSMVPSLLLDEKTSDITLPKQASTE